MFEQDVKTIDDVLSKAAGCSSGKSAGDFAR